VSISGKATGRLSASFRGSRCHRPRRRFGADVDAHDDAAAGRGIAAVQIDLFVLVDGWSLVAGSPIQSYGA
jgi:hypothetical protein